MVVWNTEESEADCSHSWEAELLDTWGIMPREWEQQGDHPFVKAAGTVDAAGLECLELSAFTLKNLLDSFLNQVEPSNR